MSLFFSSQDLRLITASARLYHLTFSINNDCFRTAAVREIGQHPVILPELILAQYTWKAKGQSEIVVEQRNLSNALPRGLNTKILVFPSSIIKCSNLLREN